MALFLSVAHHRPTIEATHLKPTIAITTPTQCPMPLVFKRTERPAIVLQIAASARAQNLSEAIVTFTLTDATGVPAVPLGIWDNRSGSGNTALITQVVSPERLDYRALVDFSSFTPELPVGTRSLEYTVTIEVEPDGELLELETGRIEVT